MRVQQEENKTRFRLRCIQDHYDELHRLGLYDPSRVYRNLYEDAQLKNERRKNLVLQGEVAKLAFQMSFQNVLSLQLQAGRRRSGVVLNRTQQQTADDLYADSKRRTFHMHRLRYEQDRRESAAILRARIGLMVDCQRNLRRIGMLQSDIRECFVSFMQVWWLAGVNNSHRYSGSRKVF